MPRSPPSATLVRQRAQPPSAVCAPILHWLCAKRAARIVAAVREGHFQLVWSKPTRRETETILRRIPGLEWARVAPLFRPEGEFTGPVDPDAFVMIADRDDRKFVALAAATKTPLVTNDNHVLAQQYGVGIEILSPRAFVARDGLEI